MKVLFTLLLFLTCHFTFAQNSWQQPLQKVLSQLDTAKTFGTWQSNINALEPLAKAHPNEFLLQYYIGWAYTQSSFQAPKGQAEPLTDKAESYVKKALDMQPTNTEALTLMAYWLSARINASPTRGATLGSDSKEYSDKAIAADSTNPRAYLLKALVVYHTPALFGGGKKKAAPLVAEAGQRFAAFKPDNALAPHWGNDIYQQLAADYKD
ncbi:hypothetical protein [Chitinophaga sp. LS1]|uniref:hypothetical protein n=1 Tax=Chitinophaga sp. LS1 TaxID=3051176 RepID=UPI002AAAD68E|nr:hypothetical protein [Chitinophaga sp. LS1]WPV66494.1 hypothetical protein QQL36_32375 [Chitinophaga sp. LS1]